MVVWTNKSWFLGKDWSDDVGHGISCELLCYDLGPLITLAWFETALLNPIFPLVYAHLITLPLLERRPPHGKQADAICRAQFMRNDVIKKGNELRFFLLLAWKIDKRLLSWLWPMREMLFYFFA